MRTALRKLERIDEIERAELSLYEFVKQAWNSVELVEFIDNWHIQLICDHLQALGDGRIQRDLLINIPPGLAKSLLTAVFWPAWLWTKRPETRFFHASYAQSLSSRDSVKCRKLIRSSWYQERWTRQQHPQRGVQPERNAAGLGEL